MKGYSLIAGLAGSALMTAAHEMTKKVNPKAPRMDLLGMQALAKGLKKFNLTVPGHQKLFQYSLVGDLLANALYFSLAGISSKKNVIGKTTMMGFTAGLGALNIPGMIGLNEKPANRTRETQIMTVALYTLGGLAAGIAMKLLQRK